MDYGTPAEWVGKLKTTDAAILNKSDPGSWIKLFRVLSIGFLNNYSLSVTRHKITIYLIWKNYILVQNREKLTYYRLQYSFIEKNGTMIVTK